MKRTKWIVGPMLFGLAALPIACGGQDTQSGPAPGADPAVGESEWAIGLLSTSTSGCVTDMLFEVTGAESIGFIAVEASEQLQDAMELTLLRVNESEALEQVAMTAVDATTIQRQRSAASRQANAASQTAAASMQAAESAVVQRDNLASQRSEAVSEATANRVASATTTATAENTFLEEQTTIISHDAQTAVVAEDAAAAAAQETATSFGATGLLGFPLGAGASSAMATESQAAEAANAVQAVDVLSEDFVDRALVTGANAQTAVANEAVQESAYDRSAVAAEEIAQLSEVASTQYARTATEANQAVSESVVESAESVLELLQESAALDQASLARTSVFVTDELASERLLVNVRIDAAQAQEIAVAQSAASQEAVQVLSGTMGGLFANAIFPAALACAGP